MDDLIIRYYNVNRFLLLIIGSWPMTKKSFINSIVQTILRFIIYVILVSSVLVQIFTFITFELTLDLFVNVSSYVFICLIYLEKYYFYLFQLENLKCLFTRIQRNWNLLIDDKEIEIMDKYTKQGKKFTFVSLVLFCATTFVLLILTSILFIYDIVVPLNGTHRLEHPFVAEYFVDEKIYYYPILLHMYIIFVVGLTVLIATETFYTICVQHACGLFHIVGYHLEQIFNQSTLIPISLSEKGLEFDDCFSRAIKSHQNAITFVDDINLCFSMSYFWLIAFGSLSLIMNCTDILQAMNPNTNYVFVGSTIRILNAFVRIVNIICYSFAIYYCGQKLIDQSTNISNKAYDIPWFLGPPKIKTLMIIILQRCSKMSTLVIGNLFPMSYELFGTVLKTVSCYITTLRALQY